MTNAELMRRAQAGDVDAFGELYALYRDPVFRLAYKYRPGEAADITQDVFVRAMGALKNWQDQGKDPLAWFYRITRNLCSDRAGAWHARMVSPISNDLLNQWDIAADSRHGPERLAIEDLVREEVLAALLGLSPDQRTALVLHYLKQLSIAEVAAAMGRQESAVKSVLVRGRSTLARALADRRSVL